MSKEKMGSRELGLVLTQQILGVDDLHYGLWDDELELKLANLGIAQQRYTDNMINAMPSPQPGPVKVFDIGCGTGHVLAQLLSRGYEADGLVPAPSLAKLVRMQQAKFPDKKSRLFECRFEDVPVDELAHQYDVCLFSESFQYISMEASFDILQKILKPGGIVVICDFFKTEHHGDGGPGDGSFGGGHAMADFYRKIKESRFALVRDDDITKHVSLNLQLVNDLLHNTIKPVGMTFDKYLSDNYPKITWIVKKLLRKKLERMNYKYFEGHRNRETFERYKTYHLMVCKLQD
ncbi:MAG: class I SAM-dependent methyltransferase [Gallionellaceae bacterium]